MLFLSYVYQKKILPLQQKLEQQLVLPLNIPTMLQQLLTLKRTHQLDAAFALAQPLVHDDSCDQTFLRTYGVLLGEMLLRDAQAKQFNQCMQWLDFFKQSSFPEDEIGVYRTLVDALRVFVEQLPEDNRSERYLSSMLDSIQTLPLHVAGISYSIFVAKTLKCKHFSRLGEFAYWCGLDHLQAKDFLPFQTTSGVKIISLAEKLSNAIAKYLLESKQKDLIADFIPKLQALYSAHPDYVYPPYYLTLLYMEIGEYDEAQQVLLPFIRKKSRDFWVWQLMAKLHSDIETKLACLCKAIVCGSRKEEMLVSLYEEAAGVFKQANELAMAKWLYNRAITLRQSNNWRISHELMDITRQNWYISTSENKNNTFLTQEAEKAELFVLGKIQSKRSTKCHPNDKRSFQGKIKKNAAGFGFVRDTKLGDIFIPAHLAANLQDGSIVRGKAIEKMDPKKQRLSLAAIKIN